MRGYKRRPAWIIGSVAGRLIACCCTLTTPAITNGMFYSRSAEEFDVPEEDGILQEVCVR